MKQKIIKSITSIFLIVMLVSCVSISVSAESVVRSASTGSTTLSNGFKVSGTTVQYSTYMYGTTNCSNVNAEKKVVNNYYYYSGSTLLGQAKSTSYTTNGFEGLSLRTNFISEASGIVAGIKGQYYVKYSGTVIWNDSANSGTTK